MPIEPWRATCIQMRSDIVRGATTREQAREIIDRNVRRALDLIGEALDSDQPPRLVLLPEFALQGPPRGETVDEWIEKACYAVPSELTEPFAELARERGVFVGGNTFEADPELPHRHFNTSWLLDPSGEVILRYRRIHTAQWVSPHDFLDEYLDRYGLDGLFPVVETELGRIAMLACGEISVPESARALLLRGAEVMLHPTNEPITEGDEASKIAAAAANMLYVVSANVAGPIGFSDGEPLNVQDGATGPAIAGGNSRIVDFDGNTVALRADAEESVDVTAVLDVEALRAARRDLTMRNSILRTRFDVFRPLYEQAEFWPANQFLEQPMGHWEDTHAVAERAIENLVRQGVTTPAS